MAKQRELRLSQLEEALGRKYKILKNIGTGGFGEVYLGEHTQLGRKVAIKILLEIYASQPDVVKRFQREARAAATLTHPNIIDIYDVGETERLYYFVMRYVDGETLAQKMEREKKIGPAEAIHIMKQVADALDYAHENDVIHRDIKPPNIMLDQFGKPILMDFGVARIQYEGSLTKTGTMMGTPHYLAPEQPLGKPVDRRSDIYSLGIMLYEMLAGRPPFHDDNSITLIFKHINETPFPLKQLVPELDAGLCAIVHKMIEKQPEDRYQTAGEVVDALEALTRIYPAPTTLVVRRSTPGLTRNTEKLLLLAQEHLQQEKFGKAIEIYEAIRKRNPNNEAAKRELEELTSQLVEKLHRHIAEHQFGEAKKTVAQLEKILPPDEYLVLKAELTSAEQAAIRAIPELETHPGVVGGKTESLPPASESPESKPELEAALESRVFAQIDQMCEELNFSEAERLLDSVRENFPEQAEFKASTIERSRALYGQMTRAEELEKENRLEEAVQAYEDFLQIPPLFDYQVFYKLRKKTEKSLTFVQEKLFDQYLSNVDEFLKRNEFDLARQECLKVLQKEKTHEGAVAKWKVIEEKEFSERQTPFVPIEAVKAEGDETQIAPPKSKEPPRLQAPPKRFPVLLAIIAAVIIVVAGVFYFRAKKESAPSPELPVQNTPVTPIPVPKSSPPPLPTNGKIVVTSEPEGATVILGVEEKGITPLEIPDLPFGKYVVKINLKGYKDQEQEVELTQEAHTNEVPFLLEAAGPTVGILQVESVPPQASIYIGKRMLGTTPKTFSNMGVGKYNVILKMEGYNDYTGSIRVKEGETVTLSAQLVEIPKPEPLPVEPVITPGMLVEMAPDVTPPKTIKKTSPKTTSESKKHTGSVRLSVLVSETGKVLEAKVIQSAHPVLDNLALETAKEWVFQPATKKGIPVKIWHEVSFTFR